MIKITSKFNKLDQCSPNIVSRDIIIIILYYQQT